MGVQVRSFGQQLLESVAYLHELRLIHTDLKPENILLASLEAGRASAPADGRCASHQSEAGQQLGAVILGWMQWLMCAKGFSKAWYKVRNVCSRVVESRRAIWQSLGPQRRPATMMVTSCLLW